MNDDIVEIPIIDQEGLSIFDRKDRYLVPIYQRAFAWGTGDNVRPNEIIQLMDDVSTNEKTTYRLGSLVVSKQGERTFEVIDGQQRLTALFLILSSLDVKVTKEGLSYACRPSAEAVLTSIAKGTFSSDDGVSIFDPASGIVSGKLAIEQKLASQPNSAAYKANLLQKFKSVVLCRIVVPEGTDLNRYFEIMNTRGEQLEPQDIVKARLMRKLSSDSERSAFAMIWDACSNMDGYCQMHFLDTTIRTQLFGEEWTSLDYKLEESEILRFCGPSSNGTDGDPFPIKEYGFKFLVCDYPVKMVKRDDSEQFSRFESIIDFRHFLLHALKTFPECKKTDVSLDDSKLIESFEMVEKEQNDNIGDFARAFIVHLLKCRYLFDRYVIKRIYDADGKSSWSLQELVAGASNNGGPSYRNTVFKEKVEDYDSHDLQMLEACFRVSFLDPKNMHWITEVLRHLVECKDGCVSGFQLQDKLLSFVRTEMRKFLTTRNCDCLGVSTPHIVLHYLDYILWQKRGVISAVIGQTDFAKGFSFEYRSSIEHWYPQNPPNNKPWPDCDRFGNLCILRGDINSRFSNLLPRSKQENHEQYLQLEHQSLKLRIMASLTETSGWDQKVCADHEKMMLDLLKEDTDE